MASFVLTGNLQLGAAADALTDYSIEVTRFKIGATAETVEVPATMGGVIHGRGGARDFNIEIGYLSNDVPDSLYSLLWSQVASPNYSGGGIVYFSGTMRDEDVAADNPSYTGSFVVTEASIGGKAEALSVGSATFPMTGPPTVATSS